jgi:hypothetical protein
LLQLVAILFGGLARSRVHHVREIADIALWFK